MKRNALLAVVYGLASLGVGVWLVERGAGGRSGDRVPGAAGGPAHPVMGEPGAGLVSEVGPDGIRWIPAESAAMPAGPGLDRLAETREEAEKRLQAFTAPAVARLPESGRELLRLGDPAIQAVADMMIGAGIPEPVLETSLRGVLGHVQRLATFQRMAHLDAERAAEQDRDYAAMDPGERPPTPPPSLHWRAEVWRRRTQEYADYMRRDLETRLGIQDAKVAERLKTIADELFAREHQKVPAEPAPIETPP